MRLSSWLPGAKARVLEALQQEGTVQLLDTATGETLMEIDKRAILVHGSRVILPTITILETDDERRS